jgi:hypothetical protein
MISPVGPQTARDVSVKEELAKRHEELAAQWAPLNREYKNALLARSVRKKLGLLDTRESYVIWPELYRIVKEMDNLALRFYGAEIGDAVRLIGKRYQGALARIEDIEMASWHGQRFTRLGEKPRIKVASPKGRHTVLISGHLWQLVR